MFFNVPPQIPSKPQVAKADPAEKVSQILERNDWYPWIVPEAVSWLEERLNETMVGVEFGAGLSTGWFCKRLKFLHTFECSHNWATQVLEKISQDHNLNFKWYLHFINCDWNKDSEGNRWYIKNNHHHRGEEELKEMEQRFLGINFPEKIDFCFVDGSVRYETFLKSIELLKNQPGAILCIDNTEKPHRAKYVENEAPVGWEKIEFINADSSNGVAAGSKTTIFVVR